MAPREIDIVVLGSTGVTGKRVLRYLAGLPEASQLKLAAAGRKLSSLQEVVSEEKLSDKVKSLQADATRPDQLRALARSTKLLLNCVGPYRFTGEAVVAACIDAATDYLDVSGEPAFIETVELKFAARAQEQGCFVASACGFDSIPADIGTIFTQQRFQAPSVPASVESFLTLHTTSGVFRANFATWESAVHGFASADQLRSLRKRARANSQGGSAPKTVGPRLKSPAGAVYDARVGSYTIPFPGSDASVVKRTQKSLAGLGGRPVQFAASFCVHSRLNLLLLAIFGLLLKLLAVRAWGRWLLLTFPAVFSCGVFRREPPTESQMQASSFTMTFIGSGFSTESAARSQNKPDREIRVRLAAPEPGYVATPIFLVQAALELLKERQAIAKRLGPGGVFTAGTLLSGTSYVKRLQNAGISLEIVSDTRHT